MCFSLPGTVMERTWGRLVHPGNDGLRLCGNKQLLSPKRMYAVILRIIVIIH